MKTLLLIALLCGGCAHAPRIIVPPFNPDVSSVGIPVSRAKAGSAKAVESVKQAVVYVTQLVPAPGQEVVIAQLKLSLQTTQEEMAFVDAMLDEALTKIPKLTAETENMKLWGAEQQRLYLDEVDTSKAERARADKAHADKFRNGRERDVFILLLSIVAAVHALSFLRPFLWKLGSIPVVGHYLLLAAPFAVPALTFALTFFAFRKIVAAVVQVTL